MKRLGFFTGAVLAGIGVFFFNQWRHVSDDDRLISVLSDHCLPYVQSGTIPFQNLGRTPGVYDQLDQDESLINGGTRLIYDRRFVAQWGAFKGTGSPVRLCSVKPVPRENTITAFAVNPDGFVARYTGVIAEFAPLIAQDITLTDTPTTLIWRSENPDQTDGLQILATVSSGRVSGITVIRDLAP